MSGFQRSEGSGVGRSSGAGVGKLVLAAAAGSLVAWVALTLIQRPTGEPPAPGQDPGGVASRREALAPGEEAPPTPALAEAPEAASGAAALPPADPPHLATRRIAAPLAAPMGAGSTTTSRPAPGGVASPRTPSGEAEAAAYDRILSQVRGDAGGAAAPGRSGPAAESSPALAAFDSGDRAQGARLLEAAYSASKDRPDVDLSAEVSRLLSVETSPERRREFLLYLARRDRTGRLLEEQIARAVRNLPAAENDAETALLVWTDLSLAYEIAQDRAQRKRVLDQLRPYVDRMIFSGRHTPLLKWHSIQPGEVLSTIAAQYQTTSDALRRLNNLKSDVIQPRQRLRVLPGKVAITVDKSEFTLTLTVDGRVLCEFPVGLGRQNATPLGSFTIRVRQKDPSWWRPGQAPLPAGDPENILGTRWLGFQETRELAGFGIHGTAEPRSIGKESSAGCVRLVKEDIELLFDFVPYGTSVVIEP